MRRRIAAHQLAVGLALAVGLCGAVAAGPARATPAVDSRQSPPPADSSALRGVPRLDPSASSPRVPAGTPPRDSAGAAAPLRDPAGKLPAGDSAGAAAPLRDPAGTPLPRDSARSAALEALWVGRPALLSRASIDQIVERARMVGARRLLVQVVGRGDAWYRSDLLPRPEALKDASLDPLGELLPRAHAAGLEVHAWVNCALVWSGPRSPRDPRHVLHAHPEWVVRLPGGRPMTRMSAAERRRLQIEGVYLNPAHPGVRTWIARIAQEIASRYAVDGIHLDYIREPGVSLASDPESRTGFAIEHGVDPERLARLPAERRARVDSMWIAWQGEQVTAVVREVRDSLARVRPGLALSAAVLGDALQAERRNAQPWRAWVRDGLIDRAYVMCYAPRVQTVLEQMLSAAVALGTGGRVVPGIAVFNSPPADVAAKIRGAAELGFRTLALYSYEALFEHAGYWPALHTRLDGTAP